MSLPRTCGLVVGLIAAVVLGLVMGLSGKADHHGSLAAGASLRVGAGHVPAQYAGLITRAAQECGSSLPPAVLAAQLRQESGFNPHATSPVGARGIAQFMPSTWARSGLDGDGDGRRDVWNPEDAIPSQGHMMCQLIKTAKAHPAYHGSPIEMALAAYNAGWRTVTRYRGVPPVTFASGQTAHYVETIMAGVAELTTHPAPDDDETAATGSWVRPVSAPVGTPYRKAGPAWASGYHTGVDFTAPSGSTVRAVGPGTVVAAGAGGAYGTQIVVRHPDGMYSQYAHLSSLAVAAGQHVAGGQAIGRSGATGNAYGPHLHLEIRTTANYGSDVDPLAYLHQHGVKTS